MSEPLVLTVQPSSLELQAGREEVALLTLRNRSDQVGQYALRVEGLEANWANVEREQVGIFPGQEERVRVRFHPPREARPAVYPVILHATVMAGDPGESFATLELAVRPAAKTKARKRGA